VFLFALHSDNVTHSLTHSLTTITTHHHHHPPPPPPSPPHHHHPSPTAQAIRKSKRPVLGFYHNILGDTPWKERKRNTITLYRGTYRYPIRCVFPKKSLLDQRLPPSFLRMMPKTGSYFRVEYYASVVLGLPFPHSNVMSMKHNILLHNSKRMDRKLKTRVERVAGCTHSSRHFY
jgi:hypothetical protein